MASEGLKPLIDTSRWSRKTWLTVELGVLCSLHATSIYTNLTVDPRMLAWDRFSLSANLAHLVSSLSWCCVYLLIICSSGDTLSKFGIWPIRPKWWDLFWFALAIGATSLYFFVSWNFRDLPKLSFEEPFRSYLRWFSATVENDAISPVSLSITAPLAALAASHIFFQAYLVTRLSELLKRPWLAILLSALFFAAASATGLKSYSEDFGVAILYGSIFALGRSLWPLVVGSWLVYAYYIVKISTHVQPYLNSGLGHRH